MGGQGCIVSKVQSGETIADIDSGDIPLGLTTSSQQVYYLTLVSKFLGGYQVKITPVDPFSAKPSQNLMLDSQDEVSSIKSILYIGTGTESPVIAWADKAYKTLKLNVIGKTTITTVNIAKHDGKTPTRLSIHAPIGAKAAGHFLVNYHAEDAHWAEVYHIDKSKGAIRKAFELPKLGGSGVFSISEVGGKIYFVRHTETEVSVYSSDSDSILERRSVKPQFADSVQSLAARSAIAEVVPKGQNKYAIRSMLTLQSGDVALIRNGMHDWTRSESLAGISAAAWAEMPKDENLARNLESEIYSNFVSAYIHRVSRHIADLRHLAGWSKTLPRRILSSFGLGPAPVSEQLTSDPFGFRKLAIVATKNGRVAAIDSGSHGQVLWNIQAIQLGHGESWNVQRIIIQGDLAWILADDISKSVFVTLSGEIKTEWLFRDITKGSKLLPVAIGGTSFLVSVSEDGMPKFPASKQGDHPITIVTQRNDGSLTGWTSSGDQAVKTWDFVPSKGHQIAAMATRPEHDPVASIGRALGDRNVLYKFLSPNLMLVVTLAQETSTASATVLDTVSGQILATATHENVDISKGVSATFSENWILYVLQIDPILAGKESSGLSKSSLLTIMELYESSIPNDRGPLGPSGNVSSIESISYPPHVESATYIISNTMTDLTTTSTRQGITTRSILAYVPSLAALVSIPIGVFSPRRPVGRDPTSSEREEGLFRYLPVVDIIPTWALSHKREVLGIKGIISTPSNMESTSLILAYGDLDIFGTRTAPIGAFDILDKGFNRIQLVLTVVALALGTGVLAPMVCTFSSIETSTNSLYQVRKKQIDSLWRT